ncbi:MAG: L-threonylcarbamoyladenylate synthase, partial [Candidatus Binatia bacterium]
VVVYPTETLYGLGADASSEGAVERVAALKGRDAGKPILVIVSSREMLAGIVSEVSAAAERLMERFWPGPLTLVLPAKEGLSRLLTGGRQAIGVRISSHPLARALVEGLGRPLTSTSANRGGRSPATDLAAARGYFGSSVGAYVDGGPCGAARGSTVVDLSGTKALLVREGAVSASEIERHGVRLR